MSRYLKKLAVRVFFVLILLFGITIDSYSIIVANRVERAFSCTDCNPHNPLEPLIIIGAGHYLNAYSDMLDILKICELADLKNPNLNALTLSINKVIRQVEKASETYSTIIELSFLLEYNPQVIQTLDEFDYASLKNKHPLQVAYIDEVEKYFSNGDIRDFFIRLGEGTESILISLRRIKAQTKNNSFPDVSLLWEVNEKFSENLFIGQYAAEIFFKITD